MDMLAIQKFLSTDCLDRGYGEGSGYGYSKGSGYGYGNGNGYGSCNGEGDGSGYGKCNGNDYGSGDGSGDGDGRGDEYGTGYGYGNVYCEDIKSINGENVYIIDEVPTILKSIKGNTAKGFILTDDLELEETFVVKSGNNFAHGKTLKEANKSVLSKVFNTMSIEEKIDAFLQEFDLSKKHIAKKFFDWHNKLTGSCLQGRKIFCKEKGIDLENDFFTVLEFIELTKNSYGNEVIKKLKEVISN